MSGSMQTKQPMSFGEKLLAVIVLLVIIVIVLAILAYLTQICWNASMPKIFALPEIDFITALALYVLAVLLIKSVEMVNTYYIMVAAPPPVPMMGEESM